MGIDGSLFMPVFFLDTSVLIAYFMNEDVRSVAFIEDILHKRKRGQISSISVMESLAGDSTRDPTILASRQAVIDSMQIITINRDVATQAAFLRRDHAMKTPDALIAACALQTTNHFLTKDPDFKRLLELGILSGELY